MMTMLEIQADVARTKKARRRIALPPACGLDVDSGEEYIRLMEAGVLDDDTCAFMLAICAPYMRTEFLAAVCMMDDAQGVRHE